ncbi:MAG: LacI family DNA-binding transcriptional regulator [Tyzzerella sp.]|nr:LacI family DNA-binding transcriptional regulator [Tyzzerella sp.]
MAATIKDIAKKTGLGLATISSYLNGGNVREKNRILIEEAICELHFEVNEIARGLKTNRTRLIGIIIPELNNPFFAEVVAEMEDILRNHGYATMICDCRTDEKREAEAIEFLKKRRVDGVIAMPVAQNGTYFHELQDTGIPVVTVDRKLKDLNCDCVLVDNRGGTKEAVERFIQAGHKRIGIITGKNDVYTTKERLLGYYDALEDAGIARDDRLIANGQFTIRGGASALKELVENNADMTAVYVCNYEMMVGAMIEINELGLHIPEQLSLIGFDNMEFAKACVPRLSIVTQPTKEIAMEAANCMLDRLESGKQETVRTISLPTGFMEGKSIRLMRGQKAI